MELLKDWHWAKILRTVGMIGVGVLPALYLIVWWGVPRKVVIGFGAGAWIVGVLIKMAIYLAFVVPVVHKRLSPFWTATIQGLVSACSELGAAVLFFLFVLPEPTVPQLIGFGVGAGAAEAV